MCLRLLTVRPAFGLTGLHFNSVLSVDLPIIFPEGMASTLILNFVYPPRARFLAVQPLLLYKRKWNYRRAIFAYMKFRCSSGQLKD